MNSSGETIWPNAPGAPLAPPGGAPPISPGMVSDVRRPDAWPKVMGWVLTVFGAIGVLGGLWRVLSTAMFPLVGRTSLPGGPNPMAAMASWWIPMAVAYGLGAIVSVALLVAGIGLLQRRAWSRPLALWWAWLKLVYAIAITVVTVLMMSDMMQTILAEASAQSAKSGRGGPPPAFFSSFGVMMGVIGGVFSFVWYAALPVFVLVWFGRRAVREPMAGWAGRPDRG